MTLSHVVSFPGAPSLHAKDLLVDAQLSSLPRVVLGIAYVGPKVMGTDPSSPRYTCGYVTPALSRARIVVER